MGAKFKKGHCDAIDYTPGADVVAGTPVLLGVNLFFADVAIPANTLGALKVGGVWEVAATAADDWSQGDTLYWDDTTKKLTDTVGTNKKAGVAAADKAATAATALLLSVLQVTDSIGAS